SFYSWHFYGEHVTMNQTTNTGGGETVFTNSIFTVTSAFSGGVSNVYLSSAAGVFQTVGAGSHYLADGSPYRNAGTTTLSAGTLAYLKQRTTYPPIVLTNS